VIELVQAFIKNALQDHQIEHHAELVQLLAGDGGLDLPVVTMDALTGARIVGQTMGGGKL